MKNIILILCFCAVGLLNISAQDWAGIKIGNQIWMAENLRLPIEGSDFYNHDNYLEQKNRRS